MASSKTCLQKHTWMKAPLKTLKSTDQCSDEQNVVFIWRQCSHRTRCPETAAVLSSSLLQIIHPRFSFLLFRSLWVVLAVIPIQKEERERAHDKEEEDPYSEACIVFDGLVRHKHQMLDFLSKQPKPNADSLSCISYLSYVLIAILDILRCAHNQLVNIVNLAFLLQEVEWTSFMSKRFNLKTVLKGQDGRNGKSGTHLL